MGCEEALGWSDREGDDGRVEVAVYCEKMELLDMRVCLRRSLWACIYVDIGCSEAPAGVLVSERALFLA